MKLHYLRSEFIFFLGFTFILTGRFVFDYLTLPEAVVESYYAKPYLDAAVGFDYFTNVLIPQVGQVLLIFLSYLLLNFLLVPMLKRTVNTGFDPLRSFLALIWVMLAAWIMAHCALGLSWLAQPHLYNYDYSRISLQILALFGYHGESIINLTVGLPNAMLFIFLFLAYAAFRERLLGYLAKPGPLQEWYILITNQIVANLMVVGLLMVWLLIFKNSAHGDELMLSYLSILSIVPTSSLINGLWFIPWVGERSLWRRVIFSSFIFSFFLSLLPGLLLLALLETDAWGFAVYLAIGIVGIPIFTNYLWQKYQEIQDKQSQFRKVETELAQSTADLQFLRSQINPHFLFNALNTLYGTALTEKASRSAEGIQRLGDMMRFMLYENMADSISLSKEIHYLHNYLELQRLRIQDSENISIEAELKPAEQDYEIAPMLLIPFVENAFKHGISLQRESWIRISIYFEENSLYFIVANSMHPKKDIDTEKETGGIGLKNVTDRLALLYPNQHELFYQGDGHEFVVRLSLQLQASVYA